MELNQKGQAFAGYRLIISAFIAFFILLIIIGAINYFESLRTRTTHESLYTGLNAAKEAPNGLSVKKSNVFFSSGSAYTKYFFSAQSGLPEDCIELMAFETQAIDVSPGGALTFNNAITVNVYFRCFLKNIAEAQGIYNDCDIYCQVSLGDEKFGLP